MPYSSFSSGVCFLTGAFFKVDTYLPLNFLDVLLSGESWATTSSAAELKT